MSKNNFFPISEYYSEAIGEKIAENQNTYGISTFAVDNGNNNNSSSTCVNCEATCVGSCKAMCADSCAGNCAKSCSGTCSSYCSDSCNGNCKGTCSGSCKTDCSGTCVGNCTGNCAKTCSGGCETYCTKKCQTYCQHEQVYSKNHGENNPGGKVFTWNTTVKKDETIFLTAKEWNRLADYIKAAEKYCYSDYSPSSPMSIAEVKSGEPISAYYYNSMNDGVNKIGSSGESNKKKNVHLITASNINALKNGYNNALIRPNLPSDSSSKPNACCQSQQYCMTKKEGRPSLQPCQKGQVCPQTP